MLNKKALAASVSAPPAEYVEDVFSTYLYTGNDTGQTITNNIDLSGEGGMVWIKDRTQVSTARIVDTVRGTTNGLIPSTTGSTTVSNSVTNFTSTGFTVGNNLNVNDSNGTFCSWTFRKAEKFFDIVTYTGDGTTNRQVSHNLGSVPGMLIIKRTDSTSDWFVLCRNSSGGYEGVYLNKTDASLGNSGSAAGAGLFSTYFDPEEYWGASLANINGATYVAYLFAHDAGGFGTAGTDNIISCGSVTTTSADYVDVNLGYEPQYVLIKAASGTTSNWEITDVMRGMNNTSHALIRANTSAAESILTPSAVIPTATGFRVQSNAYWGSGVTLIYMAIRRPMKTPTSGTEVFKTTAGNGTGTSNYQLTGVGFPPDLSIVSTYLNAGGYSHLFNDKLRGGGYYLDPTDTTAETYLASYGAQVFGQDGITFGSDDGNAWNANTAVSRFFFKRATGFFDQVCYTGTGSATTVTHNLGVAPELMIVKRRNTTNAWVVYANNDNTDYLVLNTTAATVDDNTYWNDTSPTSTVFSVGTNNAVNASASTYVAYLFATLTGVSKVGSYTGNGSNQTINCGFTAGARFVLIKRTDSTGDWYVYDTARGIVSGNDPQFKLNTTDAQATGYDAVDPDNSGFIVNNDATNFPINVNNATYIYLAIA